MQQLISENDQLNLNIIFYFGLHTSYVHTLAFIQRVVWQKCATRTFKQGKHKLFSKITNGSPNVKLQISLQM